MYAFALKGRIYLYRIRPSDGRLVFLYNHNTDNTEEFEVIIDLLRNEKPVFFVTETRTIRTGLEPVGEEET